MTELKPVDMIQAVTATQRGVRLQEIIGAIEKLKEKKQEGGT